MANTFEWILIIVSTLIFFQSFNRITNYQSKKVADYIILVIYLFNCLPVLLDNTIGIPKYVPWFNNFKIALNNDFVNTVYSIYLILIMGSLHFFVKIFNSKNETVIYEKNKSLIFTSKTLPFIILLPYLHILISGNLSKYFIYATFSERGLSNIFYQINTILIFVSLFSFCCLFFLRKLKMKDLLIIITYALSIAWIDGKRYIVVTILVMFLFFFLNSLNAKMKNLPFKRIFLTVVIGFMFFNYIYSTQIKPVATESFDSVYMSLRIDLGRDDVTKFVLYEELIENDPILDYRGQTFLSTIFMLVPREVWQDKPYPHYRYLTAALYETSSVLNLPAGMTPSLLEMSIANMGVLCGMLFTVFFLLFVCWWIDRCPSVPRKALYLLLILGLLTQSMDALIAYLLIAPISAFGSWAKKSVRTNKTYIKVVKTEG